MEKVLNPVNSSEERELFSLKLKLEHIMTTFQEERLRFEHEHRIKISKLEKQIGQKNHIINMLNKDLLNTGQELKACLKEAEHYKKIIAELKNQFFKIGTAVNRIGIDCQLSAHNEQKSKKSRSTRHVESNQAMHKLVVPTSPAKVIKFDINGYFQSLKESQLPKQEHFYVRQDQSAKTKNTDNSVKDNFSLKLTDTTCFKELINNQLGLYTLLKDAKSSKKCIEPEQPITYSKTSLEIFKENLRRTVK